MVNGRFLHLVVLLVNPLTPWSIHDSPLKNTELFLHWPLGKFLCTVARNRFSMQYTVYAQCEISEKAIKSRGVALKRCLAGRIM